MYRLAKGVSFLAKSSRLHLEIRVNADAKRRRMRFRLDVAQTLSSSRSHQPTARERAVSGARTVVRPCREMSDSERSYTQIRKGMVKRAMNHPESTSQEGTGTEEGVRAKNDKTIFTLPTMLTLARVAAIPLLVAGFSVNQPWSAVACCSLFIAASITDWLDGFLARKMNTFSSFGAFLDPVADKLMVAAALILLSSSPIPAGHFEANKWILPMLSLMIIGREIAMSALREWAASVSKEAYKAVAVSSWGKVKTASQMTSIVLLILASDQRIPHVSILTDVGLALLTFAAYLSLYSLSRYFKGVWKYL